MCTRVAQLEKDALTCDWLPAGSGRTDLRIHLNFERFGVDSMLEVPKSNAVLYRTAENDDSRMFLAHEFSQNGNDALVLSIKNLIPSHLKCTKHCENLGEKYVPPIKYHQMLISDFENHDKSKERNKVKYFESCFEIKFENRDAREKG